MTFEDYLRQATVIASMLQDFDDAVVLAEPAFASIFTLNEPGRQIKQRRKKATIFGGQFFGGSL